MSKTLTNNQFVEQTCTLTQCMLNVMVLETNGKPTSVAVFSTAIGQVIGIVAKAVVEQSDGDIDEFMRAIIKTAKEVMHEDGVIADYMNDALRAYEGYAEVMRQATQTKEQLH